VGLWKNNRSGGSFLVILDLRSVMALELDFGLMWCGNQVLKTTFLNLLTLGHCKDASMADHLEFSSGSHQCIKASSIPTNQTNQLLP
jgi:hypothetical protein